jgi:hypothetical protein
VGISPSYLRPPTSAQEPTSAQAGGQLRRGPQEPTSALAEDSYDAGAGTNLVASGRRLGVRLGNAAARGDGIIRGAQPDVGMASQSSVVAPG